jgi:hypothetical protein
MRRGHGKRSRKNSSGSGGIAVAASFQSKSAGSPPRRLAKSSASRAFVHKKTAVAAKTMRKTAALVAIVVQKTCR